MKLLHDSDKCIGCKACQVACKDIHNLPAGKLVMEIIERESMVNGLPGVRYEMRSCNVCRDRVCIDACPMSCITVIETK